MTLDEQFEDLLFEQDKLDLGDLENHLNTIDHKDLDPHTDDAFFLDILAPHLDPKHDDDDGQGVKESRVLSVPERMKVGQRMRRMAKRFAVLRKIRAKRMAPNDRLQYRARKAALLALKRKVAGAQGQKYNELSRSQKMAIDQQVDRRYGSKLATLVGTLSRRLLPNVRKKEMVRLAKARGSKSPSQGNPQPIMAGEEFVLETKEMGFIDPTKTDPTKQNPLEKKHKDPLSLTHVGARKKLYIKNIDEDDADDSASRLTPKVDMLLRLGLSDKSQITQDRNALRHGTRSLANPDLRARIMGLMDKLLNLSTSDPQIYSRMRMNVQKESTDTLLKKQDAERDNLAIRQERERASQKIIATRKKVTSNNKIAENLMKKAETSGISLDIIEQVYSRGLKTNRNAFDRVNSFINGGMARYTVDADLWEAVEPPDTIKSQSIPTTVRHFPHHATDVQVMPKSMYHHLDPKLPLTHGVKDALAMRDRDVDSDVDKFDKKNSGVPDETPGVPDKTKILLAKLKGEKKHTKVGNAFESVTNHKARAKRRAKRIADTASGARRSDADRSDATTDGVMGQTLASVFPNKKKLATEEGGAGEEGTDNLRKQYAKDTPGQYQYIDIAPFSASKSWEVDETRDTLKTPKTFQRIRMALAGHREVKESTGKVDELSIPKMIQYSTASRSQAAAHSRIFKGNKVTPADDALVAKRKSGDELVSKRLARKYKQIG